MSSNIRQKSLSSRVAEEMTMPCKQRQEHSEEGNRHNAVPTSLWNGTGRAQTQGITGRSLGTDTFCQLCTFAGVTKWCNCPKSLRDRRAARIRELWGLRMVERRIPRAARSHRVSDVLEERRQPMATIRSLLLGNALTNVRERKWH
jgi:hypothetical protein